MGIGMVQIQGIFYVKVPGIGMDIFSGMDHLPGIKGWPKKNLTKMHRSFCLISLATNMLEGWDIIHWKGVIHSFVWSTKTFLFDIRKPRYKQIKMEC